MAKCTEYGFHERYAKDTSLTQPLAFRHATNLTVSGKSYVIPADILVLPNHIAVQCHPKYWGNDSMDWKPSRFIESPKPGSLDAESFKAPRKGQYLAWSEGQNPTY